MLNEIGIIFGGNSTEHDASIHSYINVINSYISDGSIKSVKKVLYIKDRELFVFDKNFPKAENELMRVTAKPIAELIKQLDVDLYWFSLLHGNEGEDGAFQGLAEIFNLNGSFGNLMPACLSMNKWLMSEIASVITKNNVSLIPYIKLNAESSMKDIGNFTKDYPSDSYVIKPNRLGASLFTKKIIRDDLLPFFKSEEFLEMLKYDNIILLQKYISGREFTLGIIQDGSNLISLPIVEIFTHDKFLGHKEKHKKGFVEVTLDKTEDGIKSLIINNSKILFNELGFSNFCRFDYMYADGKLYLLEANSIPGLMSCSIFTRMLKKNNMEIPEMINIFSKNNIKRPTKKFRYEIE